MILRSLILNLTVLFSWVSNNLLFLVVLHRRFVGKDKVSKWSKTPPATSRTRQSNIVIHLPGCKSAAKDAKSVLDTFSLFFDEHVIDLLVKNTNIYINTKVQPNFERVRDARLVSPNEMKAFVGLLIVAGVMRSSHLNFQDLFDEGDLASDFFRMTMSYQRFLFIIRCIRFDDIRTRKERVLTDKLAAIRDLFENIVSKFQQYFTPSEYVTIDEQLVAFRGHCNFRQYIPSKPNRYGIKIFAMCDARNFYISNLEIYAGKHPTGPYLVSNSAEDVVMRLTRPIYKTGRNVTVDNWFTSIPLANNLEKHKLTLVGTLRKNKKEVPLEFLPKKSREVKSSLFGFTKSTTLLSYVPKKSKAVLLLSTMHHDAKVDPESGADRKPEILTFYNMSKGGVDTADKLCSTYNVGRRTRRWPLAIFFHIINVCALNSLIIYNLNNPEEPTVRRNFLKMLGRELVKFHQKDRVQMSQTPAKIRKLLSEQFEVTSQPETPTTSTRKRCHLCPRAKNRHSQQICSQCHKNICSEHTIKFCSECFASNV